MLSPSISAATPEAMTDSPSGRSSRGPHQLASTMTCGALFAYGYVFNLRPRATKDVLLFGTLVHAYLQYHYAAMMPDPPAWFARTKLADQLAKEGEGRPDLVRAASECFEQYKTRWAAEPFTPIAVEQEFKATIGELDPGGPDPTLDSEIVSCRSDLVVERNGLVWIIDHKTAAPDHRTGRLSKWKDDGEWRLNLQVLVNLLIVRKRLPDRFVDSFTINRIKSERPYDDWDRHTIQVPAPAYAIAARQIREAVSRERDIRRQLANGQMPSGNFAACFGRYGACPYLDICGATSVEAQERAIDKLYVIR